MWAGIGEGRFLLGCGDGVVKGFGGVIWYFVFVVAVFFGYGGRGPS